MEECGKNNKYNKADLTELKNDFYYYSYIRSSQFKNYIDECLSEFDDKHIINIWKNKTTEEIFEEAFRIKVWRIPELFVILKKAIKVMKKEYDRRY